MEPLLDSLCHGVTACSAMAEMLQHQKRMQVGPFSTRSAEEKQKGRKTVAFLMAAVYTGACPACKRPIR